MTSTRSFRWLLVATCAIGSAVGLMVTATAQGHPLLSWRLGVALALGAVGGAVVSLLAGWLAARRSADSETLRDRQATGCQYNVGLCLCPEPPYRYEGCKAPQRVADRR